MTDPAEPPMNELAGVPTSDERLHSEPEAPPPSVVCRRCGKSVEPTEFCIYCRARLRPRDGSAHSSLPEVGPAQTLVRTCWVFTGMLLVTLVVGWIGRFGDQSAGFEDRNHLDRELTILTVAEAIDLFLVAVAIVWIGRVSVPKKPRRMVRLACWLSAVPVLVCLLVLNFAYHWLLNAGLGLPAGAPNNQDSPGAWLAVWIVSVHCLQPALVEELFFRRLALGSLTTVSGIHAAVLVSSIMFGVAHIGMMFSIPLFIGIGIVLGYMRVWSGGLALPILLHFGHNAAITYLQYFR